MAGAIAALAVLAVIYGIYGWVRTSLLHSTVVAPSCLELLGSTTSEDNGITSIVGTLRNSCDRKYDFVQVTFKLDRTDNVDLPEGMAFAYARDLKPGDTLQFKSALPVPRNVSYRVDEISAY